MDMSNLLGWIEPDARTNEQTNIHDEIMSTLPKLSFAGASPPPVGTVKLLTDLWKHPRVVSLLGQPFTGIHQLTGSCVWAGGQNVGFTRCCVDVLINDEFEELIYPFMLGNYGQSRLLGGMRGKGEGSFGSTFAKSCGKDGSPNNKINGIPNFTGIDNGYYYSTGIEYAWSDGTNVPNSQVMTEGRNHLDKVVELDSADAVREMLLANNPVTNAYGQYIGSNVRTVGSGNEQIVVGTYNTSGGHQTSYLGYAHLSHGEYFLYMNQWPRSYYPIPGLGAPIGAIWTPKSEVEKVCKSGDGEVFAWLDKNGYVPPTFSYRV